MCAAIVAWVAPANLALQIGTFVFVSIILAIIGSKVFSNKPSDGKVNPNPVYSIIDKEAIVTKEINNTNGTGKVIINGDTWSAKSSNDDIIPEGTKVKVLEIDGVKAVVEVI